MIMSSWRARPGSRGSRSSAGSRLPRAVRLVRRIGSVAPDARALYLALLAALAVMTFHESVDFPLHTPANAVLFVVLLATALRLSGVALADGGRGRAAQDGGICRRRPFSPARPRSSSPRCGRTPCPIPTMFRSRRTSARRGRSSLRTGRMRARISSRSTSRDPMFPWGSRAGSLPWPCGWTRRTPPFATAMPRRWRATGMARPRSGRSRSPSAIRPRSARTAISMRGSCRGFRRRKSAP